MPKPDYTCITVKKEAYKKLKDIIRKINAMEKREKFRSVAHFVEEATEEYYKEFMSPRFKHINVYEDHATIYDKKLDRLVDVYFRNKPYCEYCWSHECEHVQFALTVPKIVKMLKKSGWIIEDGKVKKAPH